EYFTRTIGAIEKKEKIAPDFATAAVQHEGIAADAPGALPALRPVVEDAVPAVTVAGKKVVVSNGAELLRPDRSLLFLVNDLEREPFAFCYRARNGHVLILTLTIDINLGPHPIATQHRQNQPRIIPARQGA